MAKRPTRAKAPAATPAPVTPAPRAMTDAEVAALVTAWDAARTELQDAGNAVAELQLRFDAIDAEEDSQDLNTQLTAAQERSAAAQAAIKALTPLPEGVTLPAAAKPNTEGTTAAAVASPAAPAAAAVEPVLAAGMEGSQTQPAATHTTQSDEGQEGETGPIAGLATEDPEIERDSVDIADVARAEFQWQLDEARSLGTDEALSFLQSRRAEVTVMADLCVEFGAALDAEIAKLATPAVDLVAGTVTVTGPAAGRWRAGRHFTPEPQTFAPGDLTSDELVRMQADPTLTVVVSE